MIGDIKAYLVDKYMILDPYLYGIVCQNTLSQGKKIVLHSIYLTYLHETNTSVFTTVSINLSPREPNVNVIFAASLIEV